MITFDVQYVIIYFCMVYRRYRQIVLYGNKALIYTKLINKLALTLTFVGRLTFIIERRAKAIFEPMAMLVERLTKNRNYVICHLNSQKCYSHSDSEVDNLLDSWRVEISAERIEVRKSTI